MPQTLPGWILFAAMLVSAMATSVTATRLFMQVAGRIPRDWRDIPASYAFGTLLIISTMLFLHVEPSP
ncbi:hypothetical protein [Methylobacterium sp. CCH5-D2]|uniref:hypothetical protein n=1 Tax=Methylobacterium sp. CCH5-D2 TaxID=1768765 RepID=UPI000834C7EB|nr:hypothetical protein [Methylobacterium sp. CCH5-D2]